MSRWMMKKILYGTFCEFLAHVASNIHLLRTICQYTALQPVLTSLHSRDPNVSVCPCKSSEIIQPSGRQQKTFDRGQGHFPCQSLRAVMLISIAEKFQLRRRMPPKCLWTFCHLRNKSQMFEKSVVIEFKRVSIQFIDSRLLTTNELARVVPLLKSTLLIGGSCQISKRTRKLKIQYVDHG